PRRPTLFPYTPLFRSLLDALGDTTRAALLAPVLNDWMALPAHERRNTRLAIFDLLKAGSSAEQHAATLLQPRVGTRLATPALIGDRKSTRLNSSHVKS